MPDEDIRYAGDKFKESLELASDGMANFLDNEVNSMLLKPLLSAIMHLGGLG